MVDELKTKSTKSKPAFKKKAEPYTIFIAVLLLLNQAPNNSDLGDHKANCHQHLWACRANTHL